MGKYDGPQFQLGLGTIDDDEAKALNPLIRIVWRAGRVTKEEFLAAEKTGSFKLVSKSDGSPVTKVDYATRDSLRSGLEAEGISAYHDDEEGQVGSVTNKVVIVTDPVDGTQNLLLGLRGFFTNVLGKYEDGVLVASVVNDPMNDELFVGGKGVGTWKFSRVDGNWVPVKLTMPDLSANPSERPFLLTDTKVYEEDRTLAKALELLGYRPEPASGSGKKMSLLVSRPNVAGMFRSQRGNPDPHDIAAAALFVSEAGGVATSLGGGELLDGDLHFYDGYAFGNPKAHRDILAANKALQALFLEQGISEDTITKQQSNEIAVEVANSVRSQFYDGES